MKYRSFQDHLLTDSLADKHVKDMLVSHLHDLCWHGAFTVFCFGLVDFRWALVLSLFLLSLLVSNLHVKVFIHNSSLYQELFRLRDLATLADFTKHVDLPFEEILQENEKRFLDALDNNTVRLREKERTAFSVILTIFLYLGSIAFWAWLGLRYRLEISAAVDWFGDMLLAYPP